MTYGIIYYWHCTKTNMGYVGQTTNTLSGRWKGHVRSAFNPKSRTGHWEFPKAIREHGVDSFVGHIIYECDTPEELSAMENYWMHELNTLWPNGYNMRDGTNFVCPQTRQLISERTRAAMAAIDHETRLLQEERKRNAMLGHSVSDEGRKNQSVAQKRRKERGDLQYFFAAGGKSALGRKHKVESIQLMRQNRSGKCVGDAHPNKRPEIRTQISARMMGHHVSEITRAKLRLTSSKLNDEQREQIVQALREKQPQKELATLFNVSLTTIKRLAKRK